MLERLEKSLQATIIVALKLKEERYDPYFLELHGEVNARLKVSVGSSQRVPFLVQSFDCQPKPRTETICALRVRLRLREVCTVGVAGGAGVAGPATAA